MKLIEFSKNVVARLDSKSLTLFVASVLHKGAAIPAASVYIDEGIALLRDALNEEFPEDPDGAGITKTARIKTLREKNAELRARLIATEDRAVKAEAKLKSPGRAVLLGYVSDLILEHGNVPEKGVKIYPHNRVASAHPVYHYPKKKPAHYPRKLEP